MAKMVRYQVLQPVFVNGTLIDPQGKKDVFVMADADLEGPALKLAPERAPRKPKEADDPRAAGASAPEDAGETPNVGEAEKTGDAGDQLSLVP